MTVLPQCPSLAPQLFHNPQPRMCPAQNGTLNHLSDRHRSNQLRPPPGPHYCSCSHIPFCVYNCSSSNTFVVNLIFNSSEIPRVVSLFLPRPFLVDICHDLQTFKRSNEAAGTACCDSPLTGGNELCGQYILSNREKFSLPLCKIQLEVKK